MTPLKLTEAEGFGPSVGITFPDGIGKKDQDDILTFPAFTEWKTTLRTNLELQQKEDHVFHSDPYTLRSVNIQSYDRFNNAQNSMGFVKLDATIERTTEGPGHRLPGVSFLRGGSVAKLMILRPNDNINERYVVMTYQPRVPAGSLQFLEIPAGMLDGENNFRLKAAKEIKEETNFEVKWEDLIDLTNLALKDSEIRDKGLKNAMYPSPGGSDEFISIMLWEKVRECSSIGPQPR